MNPCHLVEDAATLQNITETGIQGQDASRTSLNDLVTALGILHVVVGVGLEGVKSAILPLETEPEKGCEANGDEHEPNIRAHCGEIARAAVRFVHVGGVDLGEVPNGVDEGVGSRALLERTRELCEREREKLSITGKRVRGPGFRRNKAIRDTEGGVLTVDDSQARPTLKPP